MATDTSVPSPPPIPISLNFLPPPQWRSYLGLRFLLVELSCFKIQKAFLEQGSLCCLWCVAESPPGLCCCSFLSDPPLDTALQHCGFASKKLGGYGKPRAHGDKETLTVRWQMERFCVCVGSTEKQSTPTRYGAHPLDHVSRNPVAFLDVSSLPFPLLPPSVQKGEIAAC